MPERWIAKYAWKLVVALAIGPWSFADRSHAYVSDGHEYGLECNDNGFVLRSNGPVSRFIEAGAESKMVRLKHETLYLGRDCTAAHEVFGSGKWCWANGGFVAEFAAHSFGFPRQELYCEPSRDYETNCQC